MRNETGYELARALSAAARRFDAEQDVDATLRAITDTAVRTVPGVDHAGISWVERRRFVPKAATHELVAHCDRLQSELGEGPCAQAIRTRGAVYVADMASERRWPAFAPKAVERGVRSMVSVQLHAGAETLGALNLYALGAAIDPAALGVGELFATHAAMALTVKRRDDQLNRAVATRDVIGQAKGLLMAREGIGPDAAFRLLVAASQDTNRRLAEVARMLVEEHLRGVGDPPSA
ncbi:GAF and ANTAR domain-containing protein [Saccharopolyspora sp. CA-218241]|uniref:GAF and ANTAR domain-containing protein n=1 Tax=Saccharopolyspora sp. CA-218241 TaxID=3240027 RepID=UPI003D95F76C